MTMTHHTKSGSKRKAAKSEKPSKPYKGFPLSPHASGQWCKSVNAKLHYFGPWARMKKGKLVRLVDDGWQEALDRFEEEKHDLYRNRKPRPNPNRLTIADLCNHFLTSKQLLLNNQELSPRTFTDYKRITDRVVAFFGKRRLVEDLAADDFEVLRSDMAKTCGPVRLGGEIQQTRMIFKYGYDNGLIDKPVRYGQGFKRPRADVIRKHRNDNGPKMFEADAILALLDASSTQLRAMILLGVNCGFGNADCGTLPNTAIDLKGSWVDFPRPKTGILRRCPLWPETVEALKVVLAERPTPNNKDDRSLIFITKYGRRWSKDTSTNPISGEFAKLSRSIKLYRKGVGFYALRHTFQTIADEARDPVATKAIMGHTAATSDMSAVYRERISDDRLVAVSNHVHDWLFGKGGYSNE